MTYYLWKKVMVFRHTLVLQVFLDVSCGCNKINKNKITTTNLL